MLLVFGRRLLKLTPLTNPRFLEIDELLSTIHRSLIEIRIDRRNGANVAFPLCKS